MATSLFTCSVSKTVSAAWYDDYDFASRGVLAYWPLDGSAADVSGNLPVGAPADVVPIDGRFGGCYLFNGFNSRVTVGNYGNPSALTMAAWIYSEESNPSRQHTIFMRYAGDQYHRLILQPAGTLAGGTAQSAGEFNQAASTEAIPINRWVHLAVTVDATTTRAYVNGILVDTATSSGPLAYSEPWSSTLIGRDALNSETFAGRIDDVILFDHVLTPEEIGALAGDVDGNDVADFWDGHDVEIELHETFSAGLADWGVYGLPIPDVTSAEGNPVPSFTTDADITCDSMGVSNAGFEYLDRHVLFEVDVKPGKPGFVDQEFATFGITKDNVNDNNASCPGFDAILRFYINNFTDEWIVDWRDETDTETRARGPVNNAQDWKHIGIRIRPDLRLDILVNDEVVHQTTRTISAAYSGTAAVYLGDRLAYHDNVKVSSTAAETRPGDVDCNRVVDSADVQQIADLDSGVRDVLNCPENGDVNCDDQIDITDALRVHQYNSGLRPTLPVCP